MLLLPSCSALRSRVLLAEGKLVAIITSCPVRQIANSRIFRKGSRRSRQPGAACRSTTAAGTRALVRKPTPAAVASRTPRRELARRHAAAAGGARRGGEIRGDDGLTGDSTSSSSSASCCAAASGALEADRDRCADCGRTPLTGEHVHLYDGRGGGVVCELCRTLRREPPVASEIVRHCEHGHTVRLTARAA